MATRHDLTRLDRSDPLAHHRGRYSLPEGVIYLDGNSLGAQPLAAADAAKGVLGEWRERLIEGWFEEGWWDLPVTVGDRLAPRIGSGPGRVLVCDTVTTNLYKVLTAALESRAGGGSVLLRDSAFPTDRYIVEALAAARGHRVSVVPVGDDLIPYLDEEVSVAVLEHVDFRTAELLDMAAVTDAAHAVGALTIWDLSHSAGVIPIELEAVGADFAVGCTYKYLNGGPGAPAYLYVAPGLLDEARNPIPGWLGHADSFAMEGAYRPDPGIRRFLTGTQPIVSMSLVDAALAASEDADIGEIRRKSMRLTDLFIELVAEDLPGLEIVSPADASQRGSQVSLRHPDAARLHPLLSQRGLIGDYRAPDLLRFGFAPLYVRYADVWDAVEILRTVVGG